MRQLTDQERNRLRSIQRSIHQPDLTAEAIEDLVTEWEPIIEPRQKEREERFSLLDATGRPTRLSAPRWLFHCLGMPHRTVHVALKSPSGLLLLQRRSQKKRDYPLLWDMAASGHVPALMDGCVLSDEEASLNEIAEELYSTWSDASTVVPSLLDGTLEPVGDLYTTYEEDEARNPPFYNDEVVRLFAGTLSAEGVARLHLYPLEVDAMLFCTVEAAWQLLGGNDVAPGCRSSLPRYLDWLAQLSQ